MTPPCAHISAIKAVRHEKRHECEACGHPVIASADPGERWLYCYPDGSFA